MATSPLDPLAGLALDVAAWLVTYALHSTVLLAAALITFAAVNRLARRSGAVADAAPALRECVGKVALLGGIATASLQLALGIEPFGLRPALIETRAVSFETVATPLAGSAIQAPVDERSVGATVGATVGPAPGPTLEPTVDAALPAAHPPALPARVPAVLSTAPLHLLPVTAILGSALRSVSALPEPAPAAVRPEPAEFAPASPASGAPAPFPIWVAAFLAVWAFVALTALARRLAGCHALGLSLAGREPIRSGRARAIFDGLCARAGLTGVELCVAPGLAAPITRGILRREVCLSPRALCDLSHDELAALLGHEVAHASRRDPAWLAVFRAFEIVFCLQPLNRVVARRLEDDAELLCDDRAVVWTGDRLPLASCLTEVASWLVPAGRTPRLAVGMAAHGARLTRRVERLVDEQHQPDAGRRRPIPTLCAAGVAAAVVVLVPGFAAERVERTPPPALRVELPTSSVPPAARKEPRPDATLGEALDALETEVDHLRAILSEREGGAALAPGLDALSQRIDSLRSREQQLALRLAHTENTLLSPDEPIRTAEVR